ncbi:MAG: HDOD domain-containing protein [Myxococcota bacterium]
MGRPRILVVDSSGQYGSLVDAVARERRWRVATLNLPDAIEVAAGAWVVVAVDDPEGVGVEALRAIRAAEASASRILVCEPRVAARVVARGEPAHQVVVKPVIRFKLGAAIDRALRVRELVQDRALADIAASLGSLPAQPRTWVALCELLDSDTATMQDAAELVEQDVAVAAKVMQLVNSGIFNRTRSVRSLFQALQLLGLGIVRDLVLSVEVVEAIGPVHLPPAVSPIDHQVLSRSVAVAARAVAPRAALDAAFTAGLLESTGRLLFAARAPELYAEVARRVQRGELTHRAEARVFGVDGHSFGAWLLANWGLPHEVVEAVRWCDHPERASGRGAPLALSVCVASRLVEEMALRQTTGRAERRISRANLAPWGLADSLDDWREKVEDLCGGLLEGAVPASIGG